MNNKHLVNIAIHHIKEENEAHGIGELKRGIYRDVNGIHAELDTVKTDILTVGNGIINLEESLGDLAWDDKVEKAKLGTTIISGGYIRTSLIKTDDLVVGENIRLGPNAIITWEHLAPEIVEEFDVGKMRWLGSFEDFPTNPGVNHGFYHTVNMCSYIWSGTEWLIISKDGTAGPKGDKGDRGTSGSYYAPSYLYSTYISSTEIRSPLITGNTGRFADSIYIGQNNGSNNKAGISALGTSDASVRMWAGSTNKLTAPFRVTQGGSVYMTKANIETETVDNKYITMGGSRIDGGRISYGSSYTIGTASYTNANRSGIIQLRGYASETSSTQTKLTQLGNNTLTFTGSNFVIGTESESRPTIITRKVLTKHLTMSIPSSVALYVDGDISISGNVGVSGSFTSKHGEDITVKNGIITKIL